MPRMLGILEGRVMVVVVACRLVENVESIIICNPGQGIPQQQLQPLYVVMVFSKGEN